MGFFVDWRLTNPLAAQVPTGVATPGKWPGKKENVCIIAILLRKWCPNKKHFAQLDLQHGGKTAGIDMIYEEITSLSPYVYHSMVKD